MGVSLIGVVFAVVAVVFSMTLHELAHGLMAYWLGDETAKAEGRLSLNPIRHIDPWMSLFLPLILYILNAPIFGGAKPVPIDSRRVRGGAFGMALVAIAGPLVNLILAFVAFFVLTKLGGLGLVDFFKMLLAINLGFFAFNILPIIPLDGSRVLYAMMPDGIREKMDDLERGLGMMIVFFMVMFFMGPLSWAMQGIVNAVLNVFVWMIF